MINIPKDIVKSFNFTFIGAGPLKETLAHYAVDNDLPVVFEEAVSKDQIWNELIKFDMLLITGLPTELYKYGISPNKLAEYHAVERPIIMIGKVSENPVLISGSGYVTEQIGSLSTLLKNILNDTNENYLLKAFSGRNYALEEYDWNILALKLKKRLDTLLSTFPKKKGK